jgi:hypothetical protein
MAELREAAYHRRVTPQAEVRHHHGFQSRRKVYPNLASEMELTGVDQLWVADITYIRLEAEFVYLAVILEPVLPAGDRLGAGSKAI